MDTALEMPGYAVGVDIGGTKLLLVVTDRMGRVVFRDKFKTPPVLDDVITAVKGVLSQTAYDPRQILGMGIGVPGRVDSRQGRVIDVPSLKWQDLPAGEKFGREFPFPVWVGNDVNLSLMGECWLGNGRNTDNLFYIAIGTGIGSAILANGSVVEGGSYSAGEIGYLLEKEDLRRGDKNAFQEFGIFEKKASGTALSLKGSSHGLSPRELFKEYARGNPLVEPVIEGFILDVSIVIANAVSLLNPDKVIIGGGVSESMDGIIEQIREMVASFSPIPTTILLAKLRGEAGALGGAALVFQKLLEMDNAIRDRGRTVSQKIP